MSTTFESFGKYVLLEKLATGGMAEVFLARGSGAGGIGKFFAIKRILPQYADSKEFIEMFKEEAKIAINLNHSNIVSIHEFGVEKGQFFLVMDYVEGRNLRQILNKMKKTNLQFSVDQIVFVIKEVAAGLDHAHRCLDGTTGKPLNITHRDMSPQNVMVSFEGEVKIVDFGIAKAESQIENTRAGTLKGKFGYMSPEQAEGLPVDLRTDIFSIGIVIWELLANDRLFVANNEINTLRKIRDCQIPSLRKINPNIHSELERIVQKALARDRNLRYQTGAAFHRDLNRFLNRQYPDFSAHDFSVFTKSVFADEILSLRKRLVDYAKINVAANASFLQGNPTDDGTATSLLSTSTDSLVISESGVETKKGSVTERIITRKDLPETPRPSVSDTTTTSAGTGTSTSTSTANTPLEISQATDPNSLPPSTPQKYNSKILDEKALAAEGRRELAVRARAPVLETEDASARRARTTTRATTRSVIRDNKPNHSKPARALTVIVSALMFLGFYAYLAKYFSANPYMVDVIKATDPYIHPLHAFLGVEKPQALAVKPNEGVTDNSSRAPVAPTPPPPQGKVMVISNPSGAEIWINNKSTGLVTPTLVEVPTGHFNIMIRKHGFSDFRLNDTTADKLSFKMTANLVKMNVAYVDIDVFPPSPDGVNIFINGRKLNTQSLPIHQLPVAANTPLKIRAETKSGNYEEVELNLGVDRRQSVQLNPHKSMRLPTNSHGD